MINTITLLTYFFMSVLIIMSVVSWAIIIYLFWDLKKYTQALQNDERFIARLQSHNWDKVHAYFNDTNCHHNLHRIYHEFINLIQKKIESSKLKQKLVDKTHLLTSSLESDRNHQLTQLATIASVSPYIGLLGTVLGIMQAFFSMGSTQSSVAIQQLAPGLAEALFATALGLIVAIPAQAAHYYFQSNFNKSHNKLLENTLTFVDNVEFVKNS